MRLDEYPNPDQDPIHMSATGDASPQLGPVQFVPLPADENTSGTDGPLPLEIACTKWSWGASSLPAFWMMAHGMAAQGVALFVAGIIAALMRKTPIYPIFNVVSCCIWIYLGFCGHELAWRKRRYDSVAQFFEVETAWKDWGIGIGVATILIFIIVVAIIVSNATTPPPPVYQTYPNYAPNPPYTHQ